MSEPLLIAEGTFGAVFKPAIPCDEVRELTNKVSKVMKTENAIAELNEYDKLDGFEKYNIAKPQICKISQRDFDKYVVGNDSRIIQVHGSNAEKYSMLQYEYGGRDLTVFALYMQGFFETDQEKLKLFWTETIKLWEGIREYRHRGLSHRDIKPQNIVYNSDTNILKFIDFFLKVANDIYTMIQDNK
jgi:serine/threonine protein kinase